MRLAAIYNVWGDCSEFLPYSIKQIRNHVDTVITVYSNYSNSGEFCPPHLPDHLIDERLFYEPDYLVSAAQNETNKRNLGLDYARLTGHTHFIHLDSDELYESNVFEHWKDKAQDYDGSACRLLTYYKHPTIRITPPEDYFVPFIHKIYPETRAGSKSYPVFADPTRTINTHKKFLTIAPNIMHHYSWVRKDIGQKLRNSSSFKSFKYRMDQLIDEFNDFDNTGRLAFFQGGWEKVPDRFGIGANFSNKNIE